MSRASMAASRLAAMPLSHLKRAVVPSARAPNALLSSLKSVAPQRTHGVLHVRLSFASWPVPPVTSARSSSVQIRALCSINPSSPTRASVGATLPAADAIRDIVASGNEGHGSGGSGSGSGWGRGGQGDRSGESRRTETAVAAFGAMLVISVHHTLQHTCSAQCQAKPPAPVKREVSTVAGALPEPEPVTLYEMFAILEGEWMWLAGAILVTFGFTFVSLNLPAAFSAVMAAVREHQSLEGPIRAFMFYQGASICLDGARHYLMAVLGERVRQKLRKRLYESLLLQEIAFFDAHGKGQLVAMMGEDVVRIQQAVTDQITSALRSVTTITYGLYRVLSISPYATLLVAAAVPVLSLASVAAQGISREKAKKAYEASRETAHMASEVLANARTVQSFGAEDMEAFRYAEAMDKSLVIEGEYRVFTGLAHLGFNALNSLIYAGGMWYGGSLVAKGKTSMEDMMQFMQYAWKIGEALGDAMHLLNEQQRALVSAARVLGVVRRQPEIARGVGDKPASVSGVLELRDVVFAYPTRPDTVVLNKLSIKLAPGTVTALVGGSGNGKSTIACLVQRFYDVQEGTVMLDGKDVKDLDLEWYRSHMALVSQEPMLFHGTVAENVRYGSPHATDAQVEAAAREANATEFIDKLPEGFQTVVSQVGLSAGQRQRISIARAILKDPAILILDEATSQLDAKSEGVVQTALDRLMKGRTVVVIAHRLSTIKDANLICVIENGEIVEQGTHADLMRQAGLYAMMAKRQMAGAKSMAGGLF